MITVYVSIGNSDDKLRQNEWAHFHLDVAEAIRANAHRVHGSWVSPSADPWQNACWCIEIDADTSPGAINLAKILRRQLGEIAGSFRQDSIAWAEVQTTEFLSA